MCYNIRVGNEPCRNTRRQNACLQAELASCISIGRSPRTRTRRVRGARQSTTKGSRFSKKEEQSWFGQRKRLCQRNEIEAIQLKKLKETVHYIYEKVAPYRKKMDEAGVKPEDIRTLEDLTKLPFTYKADFRDNYPMGLFAVDKKDLVRFHASSGTTGKPTVVGYTRHDLDVWLNNVARIAVWEGRRRTMWHRFLSAMEHLPERWVCMADWRR